MKKTTSPLEGAPEHRFRETEIGATTTPPVKKVVSQSKRPADLRKDLNVTAAKLARADIRIQQLERHVDSLTTAFNLQSQTVARAMIYIASVMKLSVDHGASVDEIFSLMRMFNELNTEAVEGTGQPLDLMDYLNASLLEHIASHPHLSEVDSEDEQTS